MLHCQARDCEEHVLEMIPNTQEKHNIPPITAVPSITQHLELRQPK